MKAFDEARARRKQERRIRDAARSRELARSDIDLTRLEADEHHVIVENYINLIRNRSYPNKPLVIYNAMMKATCDSFRLPDDNAGINNMLDHIRLHIQHLPEGKQIGFCRHLAHTVRECGIAAMDNHDKAIAQLRCSAGEYGLKICEYLAMCARYGISLRDLYDIRHTRAYRYSIVSASLEGGTACIDYGIGDGSAGINILRVEPHRLCRLRPNGIHIDWLAQMGDRIFVLPLGILHWVKQKEERILLFKIHLHHEGKRKQRCIFPRHIVLLISTYFKKHMMNALLDNETRSIYSNGYYRAWFTGNTTDENISAGFDKDFKSLNMFSI